MMGEALTMASSVPWATAVCQSSTSTGCLAPASRPNSGRQKRLPSTRHAALKLTNTRGRSGAGKHLTLRNYHLFAISGGGPYAMACLPGLRPRNLMGVTQRLSTPWNGLHNGLSGGYGTRWGMQLGAPIRRPD
ncbi:hypothetical protein B0I35DRAFT_516801 [Stachybotrys elegans]|uniref:Uncharacterized protein n=1 Tax=Stachybotrys elegans TaxID=80388 RepID=A0A8K0SER7_9HYPO|nr:hypothetical protein B0I35DRAFT_516801 [Stachybotrys elegans]